MKSLILQRETVEALEIDIECSIDPTDDTVEFAFPALGARPSSWTSGSWKGNATGSGGRYSAVATTPTVGDAAASTPADIDLDAGEYVIYARIGADLELPVIHCGTITVR